MELTRSEIVRMRHFCERAEERYKLSLDSDDLAEIRELIRAGQARLLADEGRGRRRYELCYRERRMPVIYDSWDEILVTALEAPVSWGNA